MERLPVSKIDKHISEVLSLILLCTSVVGLVIMASGIYWIARTLEDTINSSKHIEIALMRDL